MGGQKGVEGRTEGIGVSYLESVRRDTTFVMGRYEWLNFEIPLIASALSFSPLFVRLAIAGAPFSIRPSSVLHFLIQPLRGGVSNPATRSLS